MLRIHFTPDDLARLAVAPQPDPLWETLLSLHLLQSREGMAVFDDWRREVRPRVPAASRPLFEIAPPRGYSPDFLTPARGTTELAAGLDAVLSTPRRRLRAEVTELVAGRRPRPWLTRLGEGDPRLLHSLGDAVTAYHRTAVAPYWDQVVAGVAADRARRAEVLVDGGPDRLLATLHPAISRQGQVLSVGYGDRDRDLRLDGRGLLLVPSFFCWRDPITLRDPDLPPVLVYPIGHQLGWHPTRDSHGTAATRARALGTLLGRTRAAVLHAIGEGDTTTSELARAVSISPASASEHATVLREAGLTSVTRHRNTVWHALSPLGAELLRHGI